MDTRPKLIVVLGMHRSGTSAITRGLAVLGYALGDRLMPQDEAINAKGYWEDLDVVSLNDEMLEALGRPWLNLSPVSDEEARLLREAGYEDRAWGLLEERITAHGRFAFKDPRLTKLLPFWKPVLDALPWTVRYVLALRNPLNIARSLLRRDGLALEAGCLLTIDHWLAALEHAYGDETLRVVDYDRLLEAPKPTLDELASWCGTALDSEALRAFQGDFLDPRLRHFQIGSESIRTDPVVPALAVELYYALRASADGRGALPSQATVRAWRVELQRVAPMLRLSDRLVMENYRLRKRLRAGEERARRLEGALREAREEIARLEGGLATSSQTVARMAGELNTAGQNHTRLERALEEAGDVISALRAERDEAAGRLGRLEQALEAADEVISGLRAERDEAAGRIGGLEQALEAAGEVISALRAERDEAAGRIGELEQALEAAGEVISGLRAERDEAAGRIGRLEQALEEAGEVISALRAERDEAAGRIGRLEQALEEAGEVISGLRAERDEAAERIGGLEQALEAAGEVISGLRAERDEAAGRIGRLEQALEAAGEVISGLRAERDEAAERIGGLNQALEAADEVISALRAERDEAAERIGSLEEELVQARAQSQAAAERLAALYSSTSWRFTRPLRAVSAAARQAWNVPRGPRTWRRGGGRQQRGVADTDPDGRAQAEDGEEPLRWSVDSLILRGRILFGHGWLFHARTQVTSLHFRIAGMGRLPEAIIPAEIGRRRPDVAEVWGEDRADSGFIVYGAFAAGPPRGLRMDIGLADGRRIVLPVPPETIRYAEDASAWPGRWRLFPGQLRLYFRKSKATLREGGWGALKAKIVRRLHARAGSTQPSPSQLIHRLRGEAPHPVVLIVDHDLGGGANHYRRTLVNRFVSKGMTVFLLTYDVTSLSYVLDVTSARDHFRCALADPGMLLHLGRAVVYRKVVYNTAVSFAQPERVAELLLAFKQAHRVSLHIMIHDYYFICPSPFLIDHQGRFCGIPEAGVCARCLQNNAQLFAPLYRGASTEAWRAMWRSVLLESDEITIFSDSSRHLLRRAFPQVEAGKIRVAPHALPPMRRVRVRNTQSLCLGVIGQIGYHKGAAVVRDLAREIVRRGADARIVVIGALETEADRSVVRQTGSYQKDQLPALLEQEGVNVVLFPSVCPETFSYVVHEVIAMDLPLAAFDIGAQGDAVRRYAKGYVLRGEDAGALLDDLTRIFFDLYASARVGNG